MMAEWIEESKSKITRRGVISQATIDNYNKCYRTLEKFQDQKKYMLSFKGMDLKFYSKFRSFCINDLGNGINTFATRVQTLKTFLKDQIKNDVEVNPKWMFFEVPSKHTNVDFLTADQLEAIKNLRDITVRTKTKSVSADLAMYCRDIFLFQCYTALRISDVFRLKKEHIKGDKILLPDTKKTGNPVVIPFIDNFIFQPVKLVDKYSNDTDYLFTWRGEAAPDEKRVTDSMNLVLHTITNLIKCPFKITTKIGRKTFATYAIAILKMSKADVMRITGHTTETNFNRYMGFDPDAVIEAYRERAQFLKVVG